MKAPAISAAGGLLLVGTHLMMRAAGLGAHLSAIAGMPANAASLAVAALYVTVYLAAVVAAPVLVLAGIFEIAAARRRG